MSPAAVFDMTWGLWAASWIVAAFWSMAPIARLRGRRVWLPTALIVAAVVVPPVWQRAGMPSARVWDVGRSGAYALAFATIPGFLFAWWARLHLGPLRSAAVARKSGHRVVDSGPYGLVRHPIYTGILWAALVTDLASANLPALLSFTALAAGFYVKARIEERFLGAQLGQEAYAAFARRVPMLMPRSWNT